MLNKLPPGVCWRGGGGGGGGATGLLNEGGGSNRLPALVAKQAVEFPQVYTSNVIMLLCRRMHVLYQTPCSALITVEPKSVVDTLLCHKVTS